MKMQKDTTYEAKLNLPYGITAAEKNGIIEILAKTDFNSISIDISTYRRLIDPEEDDARIRAIGYIKNYDPKTQVFTVVIYNKTNEVISRFVNPVVSVLYKASVKGNIRITKFIIEPGGVIAESKEEPAETTTDNSSKDE